MSRNFAETAGPSCAGALALGFFGFLLGTAWKHALNLESPKLTQTVALVAAGWGVFAVHLIPSGVSMDDKPILNMPAIVLHGWIACFLSLGAILFWPLRVLLFGRKQRNG